MGADLHFLASASEQLTVVSERGSIVAVPRRAGRKQPALQDMSAVCWTSEARMTVNYCSGASVCTLQGFITVDNTYASHNGCPFNET